MHSDLAALRRGPGLELAPVAELHPASIRPDLRPGADVLSRAFMLQPGRYQLSEVGGWCFTGQTRASRLQRPGEDRAATERWSGSHPPGAAGAIRTAEPALRTMLFDLCRQTRGRRWPVRWGRAALRRQRRQPAWRRGEKRRRRRRRRWGRGGAGPCAWELGSSKGLCYAHPAGGRLCSVRSVAPCACALAAWPLPLQSGWLLLLTVPYERCGATAECAQRKREQHEAGAPSGA